MKINCPYCHSYAVCESTDTKANELIDDLSSPAVVSHAVSKLCQSMIVHPLIKLVLSMTLVIAIEHVTSNRGVLPVTQTPYRCEDCNKVFTVFYPFV